MLSVTLHTRFLSFQNRKCLVSVVLLAQRVNRRPRTFTRLLSTDSQSVVSASFTIPTIVENIGCDAVLEIARPILIDRFLPLEFNLNLIAASRDARLLFSNDSTGTRTHDFILERDVN